MDRSSNPDVNASKKELNSQNPPPETDSSSEEATDVERGEETSKSQNGPKK